MVLLTLNYNTNNSVLRMLKTIRAFKTAQTNYIVSISVWGEGVKYERNVGLEINITKYIVSPIGLSSISKFLCPKYLTKDFQYGY